MSEQVTKSKNEGRVQAGKRLAEWNKRQKENLLKNKGQAEPSDQQDRLVAQQDRPAALQDRLAALQDRLAAQQEQQQQQPRSQASIYYGSGAVMVFAVIGVALYLALPRRQASPATPVVQDDIFSMN